jgi:hypothetical protein
MATFEPSPASEHYTKGALLDGLWQRPELLPRDRSIVTGK